MTQEERVRREREMLARLGGRRPPAAIPRRPGKGPCPASHMQQRMWFLQQLAPASPAYNIVEARRLDGPLDLAALEQAFGLLIARHEPLRTTFEAKSGEPLQVVNPPAPFHLAVADVSAEADPEAAGRALLQTAAGRPFDLGKDLMLRALVVRVAADCHLLLVAVHHIACDGWSLDVMWRELGEGYAALREGRPPDLPELPITYRDFTEWQRAELTEESLQPDLAWWQEVLADPPAELRLPPVGSYDGENWRGGRCPVPVPPGLALALRDYCRSAGLTTFAVLAAAYGVLLGRYGRQDEIIIGFPVIGRDRLETEPLVGLFVNTTVLRVRLNRDRSFDDLARDMREQGIEALEHARLPFDKLVEVVGGPRRAGSSALTQVLLGLYPAAVELALPGLTVSRLEVETGAARADLTLSLTETGDDLAGWLEHSLDVLDQPAAARLAGQFVTLLEEALRDPGRPLAALCLAGPEERQQIVAGWNDTHADYPRQAALHDLFQRQAGRRPEAVAVEGKGERLTYAELARRAGLVAAHLAERGVQPGDAVGLWLDRSPEWVAAMLGVLQAGAAYLPLDPAYPAERRALMLLDAGARVVVTTSQAAAALPAGTPTLLLDTMGPAPALPARVVSADSPAYIMYTSGSTGRPKGVVVPHRAVARLVLGADYCRLGPDDVLLQGSNCAFDAATFEIWGALLNGGRLVVVDKEVMLSPERLSAELLDRGVTVLWLTTALFNQLAGVAPGMFGGLRYLLFGGEAADARAVRRVLAAGPPEHLINCYGPTENTTFSTTYEIRDLPADAVGVPIGRPISNSTAYLLDQGGQPAAVGVPGELYVGGDGLALGYLGQPELTAERFIGHPLDPTPGARVYRTGDIARYRPDGNLEFLGRVDDQVKIRGFRIEPGEVEAALHQHPAIAQCAVLVRDDPSGEKRLVAYVAAGAGSAPPPAELRAFLAGRLPDYMVPLDYVILPALPLNANGKVDRAALPAPAPRGPAATVEAADALQRRLTEIWESVLGVRPVGPHDNFFELGGHSLLALRMFALVERLLGARLPLASIFHAPTVSGLAALLRAEGWSPAQSCLVPIQMGGAAPPFFCVHPAGGLVLSYQRLARLLGPDQPFYGVQEYEGPGAPVQYTVEELAAGYLQEIRALQPTGPYHLGGHSFGGLVAFEMARQLHAKGEQVGLLALFDSYGPRRPDTLHFGHRTRRLLRKVRALSLGRKVTTAMPAAVHWAWEQVMRVVFAAWRAAGRPFPRRLKDAADYYYYRRLTTDYRPAPYPGRLTLFRSTGWDWGVFDPELWWSGLAGSVEVHEIAGSHVDIITGEEVAALAAALGQCLRQWAEREETT